MKILVAAIHYPVASGRFIANALRRLGHDVRTVGPYTANQIWGIEVDPKWNWEPTYRISKSMEGLDLETLVSIGDWRPDLIIAADSAFTLHSVGAPHILIGQDNHVRDYQMRKWDAMFLCHTWGSRVDEPNAFWLPPCYDPTVCIDEHRERDIDVAMIGVPYAARNELAEAFHASGLKVFFGFGLLYDDYRALYNRVKIALNLSAMDDITNRILETMAMGCCVLTNPCRDFEKIGFRHGIELMTFSDTQDALAQARGLLESDTWKKIAQHGQVAALPHTWDDRMRYVLDTVRDMGLIDHA